MNAGKHPKRGAELRDQEALWWFARLQEADLTERVLDRWNQWYAAPENRRAFDSVESLSRRFKDARPFLTIPTGPKEGYDGSETVQAWNARIGRRARLRPRARFAMVAMALAAAAALVAVGLKWAWSTSGTMETSIAEHKEMTLEDGSKIFLGAKTAVKTTITSRARTIVLLRGEALFQVARDPSRPFEVMAGGGSITAIGTAFNVRQREDDHVVVTVSEGAVWVAPLGRESHQDRPQVFTSGVTDPAARKLTQGQELTFGPEGHIGAPRAAEEGLSAEWRHGRLRYRSEPLRNVVPDLGRYSRRPLTLADEAAGKLLFSGTVYESDVDEWVAGLERIYPELEVTVTDGEEVLIRMRSAPR
jgi:transmembrane sensor